MSNFPVIYPNETIFSWLTRAYLLSGYVNTKVFYLSVFNTAKVRIHPYLNNRLNQLSAQSLHTGSELLNHHTLYPLFKTFALKENQENLKSKLLSNEVLAVSTAGITQFNFPLFHGHKYCPSCVKEDIKKYGCGYWHIQHQIPAVCCCYRHGILLKGVEAGDIKLDKKLILPSRNGKSVIAAQIDILFAQFTADTLNHLQNEEALDHYQSLYSQQLNIKNLLSRAGQLRSKKIVAELHEYCQSLTTLNSNELSIPDELLSFNFIGRLCCSGDYHGSHPVKHLLFSFWLFDGHPDALFGPNVKAKPCSRKPPKNSYKDSVIIEMLHNGDSYNSIYRQTGRSSCYIKRIASLNKIDCQSNGKKISRVMVRTILMKALLGQHRLSIAQLFDISIGSVEQIISTEPVLVAWRKYLRYQNKKLPYISEITSYVDNNPACMRKDVKANCNAAFFWCFLYEKEWLNSILPKAHKPKRQLCDWRSRDNEAVIKIDSVLKTSVEIISITQLDHLIGGKKWLTSFIDKLPKSKRLIAVLIKSNKLMSKTPEKYFK
jgi:hypothetical protein